MPYPWEVPPPVYQYVGDAHNQFMAKGDELSNKATEYASRLANFNYNLAPSVFTTGFDFNGQLSGFNRPATPQINLDEFQTTPVAPVQAPASFTARDITGLSIPELTATPPVSSNLAKPVAPLISVPTAPARPSLPPLPAEPDFASLTPAPVTLESLNLPTIPSVALPAFTATRPQFNAPVLSQDGWQFTPETYVSALLDKIKSRLTLWMEGQQALPAAIERALYDRGRARIEEEVDENIERVWDEFGARGFSAPPGQVAARVDDLVFKGDTRKAEFNTTATLKSFDEALANMRLAVQQGISLEGVTINLHIEGQRLLLASAQHLRDTGIALLNAAIAEFNALMQGYQTDAAVHETRLKAALSVLEEARLRIEAEKLKGEINEQSVRAYVAAWEGVRTAASAYESRVKAVSAQAEMLKIPIEIFAEETRAFEAVWNAHGKEWDGYRAGIEADGIKSQNYRALVEAHNTRIQGIVAIGNHEIEAERLRVAQNGQEIQLFEAGIRGVEAALGQERNRLSALAQKVQAQATIFAAQAQLETAAAAATDRTFELGLEKAKAESSAHLETNRMRSQEKVQLLQLLQEAMKTVATVLTQLASSTMSAMNYSAGISGSISSGYTLTESREL